MSRSIGSLISDLKREYGEIPVHITPVCSDNPLYRLDSAQAFVDAVDDVYEERAKGNDINFSLLAGLETCLKHGIYSEYLCNAGLGTISVSVSGDIYPCFYFTDRTDFHVANVGDDSYVIDAAIERMRLDYSSKKKLELPVCRDCFANTVCHGCLGANLDSTGNLFRNSITSCEITRQMLEKLLIRLVGISEKGE